MVSIYNGKGDASGCESYRRVKLLEHEMKVFEGGYIEQEYRRRGYQH